MCQIDPMSLGKTLFNLNLIYVQKVDHLNVNSSEIHLLTLSVNTLFIYDAVNEIK
jgi:hypothetical protein